MVIAIIGGGNIGTLMGAEFAARGHEVRMFVSDPENWSDRITVFDANDNVILAGNLSMVTSDLAKAVEDADYVWVTYPTSAQGELARKLLPLTEPGMRIGVVPGNDAEFIFADHVKRGAVLFGLQRVHSISRLKQRGSSVYELGRKPELQVAAIPAAQMGEIAHDLANHFDLPVVQLPSYLILTLTPSNPILHTTRICSMFGDWKPGVAFDHNILFYEEWTLDSAELLLACDDELQLVCRALEERLGLDLSQVKSLRDHYESPDAPAMRAKIAGIPAFKGLTSPMLEEAPGRWVPDFSSRYFKADFAFGLRAIKDIAALVGVSAPNIDYVYDWYVRVSKDTASFDAVPSSINDFAALYE